MSYIGNNPDVNAFTIGVDRFNGTGACTQFTLTRSIDDAKAIEVIVNGVQQDPDNAYTVTDGVITFSEAPTTGSNNIIVLRRTGTTYTRTQIAAGDILPNAVTSAAIADSAVGTTELASLAVTGDKIGLTSINANNIVNATITEAKLANPPLNPFLLSGM